jgi:hypothetical protein
MARKLISHLAAEPTAWIPINTELNLISFYDVMQDSEYERQQEIEYPMDTTWA